jgi:hypothetical protein
MPGECQNNHYVPVWYQKRFLPVGQMDQELYYLDFQPGFFVDSNGVTRSRRTVRKQGFTCCFAEKDLYTIRFGVEAPRVSRFKNNSLGGDLGVSSELDARTALCHF